MGGVIDLVYEDDYGGMFSPYVLTRVFPEDQEQQARDYLGGRLGTIIKAGYNGSLDISAYKYYLGGLFSDD